MKKKQMQMKELKVLCAISLDLANILKDSHEAAIKPIKESPRTGHDYEALPYSDHESGISTRGFKAVRRDNQEAFPPCVRSEAGDRICRHAN
jgi:hypothetical protein